MRHFLLEIWILAAILENGRHGRIMQIYAIPTISY